MSYQYKTIVKNIHDIQIENKVRLLSLYYHCNSSCLVVPRYINVSWPQPLLIADDPI